MIERAKPKHSSGGELPAVNERTALLVLEAFHTITDQQRRGVSPKSWEEVQMEKIFSENPAIGTFIHRMTRLLETEEDKRSCTLAGALAYALVAGELELNGLNTPIVDQERAEQLASCYDLSAASNPDDKRRRSVKIWRDSFEGIGKLLRSDYITLRALDAAIPLLSESGEHSNDENIFHTRRDIIIVCAWGVHTLLEEAFRSQTSQQN